MSSAAKLAIALVLLPGIAFSETVTVFAAASLKDALDEVASGFEAATDHDIAISYAGSGLLARQIIAGAPADIYISANQDWMDEVEAAGLIADGTRRDLLGNELVLIAHEPPPEPLEITADLDLPALLGDGKLAMALTEAVPAGQYGKAALDHFGLWDEVAPMVAEGDNVRAALAFVATGEAAFGIVYATDAKAEPRVSIAATFPAESHDPITYPAALLSGAADDADRAFFEALNGAEARAIFADHGFRPLD